jgi:hypothetical protein
MTQGICKIKDGWVNEYSVWVRSDEGRKLRISESQYRSEGYKPPVELLPECRGEQHA